jgi:hypothetical protein
LTGCDDNTFTNSIVASTVATSVATAAANSVDSSVAVDWREKNDKAESPA